MAKRLKTCLGLTVLVSGICFPNKRPCCLPGCKLNLETGQCPIAIQLKYRWPWHLTTSYTTMHILYCSLWSEQRIGVFPVSKPTRTSTWRWTITSSSQRWPGQMRPLASRPLWIFQRRRVSSLHFMTLMPLTMMSLWVFFGIIPDINLFNFCKNWFAVEKKLWCCILQFCFYNIILIFSFF